MTSENAMVGRKVIVFGATGAVGSAVAQTASVLGATVTLALRDSSKPIPALDSLKGVHFQKIQADLNLANTVYNAVKESGAKHAFFYLAHGSPDHMRATITAMKSAGAESAVFLSSSTVQQDPASYQPDNLIPYVNAQVELNLMDIFGGNGYVAVRPGSFASNMLQYKAGLEKGLVKLFRPDAVVDCVTPDDIGRVCGTILAKGLPTGGQMAIYLFGPQLLSNADSVSILAKSLGKKHEIEEIDQEEAYRAFVEDRGVEPGRAKYVVDRIAKAPSGPAQVMGMPVSKEDQLNIEKYTGRRATTLEQWIEQNRNLFYS